MQLARSIGEQIATALRAEVLAGRLAPGAALREIDLARQFGVSRGPVREALHELIHEGLLAARPAGRVEVAPPAPAAVCHLILPVRTSLELFALRLFFDDLGPADFERWRQMLDQIRLACERRDFAALVQHDIALHRSFLERAGQPDLLAIWSVIVARLRRTLLEVFQAEKDPMRLYHANARLIETFGGGNKRAALRELKEHVSWPRYRARVRRQPGAE